MNRSPASPVRESISSIFTVKYSDRKTTTNEDFGFQKAARSESIVPLFLEGMNLSSGVEPVERRAIAKLDAPRGIQSDGAGLYELGEGP